MLSLEWGDTELVCVSGYVDESVQGEVVTPFFVVTIHADTIAGLLTADSDTVASLKSDGVLLAKGRVLGAPAQLGGETIDIEFTCKPADYDDKLKAAADELRVGELPTDAPYDPDDPADGSEEYDPLYFSRDAADDPASVLVARPEKWRWNRLTMELERIHIAKAGVIAADSLTGELVPQDVVDIDTEGFESSLRIQTVNPPRAVSKLRVIASFTQTARGKQTYPVGVTGLDVKTYSFDDLMSALPQPGTPIGTNTGWSVGEVRATDVPDSILDSFDLPKSYVNDDEAVTLVQANLQAHALNIQIRLAYDYTQQRQELLDIEMPAWIQRMLGDDQKETVDQIQLAPLNLDNETPEWVAYDPETLDPKEYAIGDMAQANGKVWTCVQVPDHTEQFRAGKVGPAPTYEWIRWWAEAPKRAARSDSSSAVYIGTDRGTRTVRHGVHRLARKVLERAMCEEVYFECDLGVGMYLSTADECRIKNRRFAASGQQLGYAQGKVTSLRLMFNGAERKAGVTMLVAPGKTGSPTTEGDEAAGDITYKLTAPAPRTPVNAAALATQAAVTTIENAYADQKTAATNAANLGGDAIATLQSMPTRIRLSVLPIQEEDLIIRRVKAVADQLPIPHGIDL